MIPLGRRTLLGSLPVAALLARAAAAQAREVTIGTSSEGGEFILYGAALVDMLHLADPTFEIRAVSTKGTGDNVALLQSGDIDLGFVAGEVMHELFAGLAGPRTSLKVVSVMYSTPGMFAVRADSRHRCIMDLRGRRVVWGTRTSGLVVQARYVMGALGLDIDEDFEPIYVERLTDAAPMVKDGQAAALWGGGRRWPGFVEIANSPRGARFVGPTAEEIGRILDKHDFMARLTVPAGLYPGQYDPIETVGTWSFIVARDGLDDAVCRRIAAALHKAERIGALTKQLAQTTVKNTLSAIPGPEFLQPGVRRYYQEAGLLK